MAVRLKSRINCPPGGFQFTIAPLGVSKTVWSFTEAVQEFRTIAMANPTIGLPTDPVVIGNFIDQQNALRCMGIHGADAYVDMEGGQARFADAKKVSLSRPGVAVADRLIQLTAGAATLREWISQGAPAVPPEEATERAKICSTCPQNGKGDLTRWFTKAASQSIRAALTATQQIELKTVHDDSLGVCEACLCPLKLKVHVQLPVILKHLTPQARASLDPRCWMLK